jgi:hypothetical protein
MNTNIIICIIVLVIFYYYYSRHMSKRPTTATIAIVAVDETATADDRQFQNIVMRNASTAGGMAYNEPPQANLMACTDRLGPACLDDIYGPDNPDSIIRTRTFAYDLAAGLTNTC